MFVLVESITVDASDASELPPAAARNWYWAAVEVNMAIFSGMMNPATLLSLAPVLMTDVSVPQVPFQCCVPSC